MCKLLSQNVSPTFQPESDAFLDTTAGNQWRELKDFLNAHARNGTAAVVQDFTNNHALAGKALRLPVGAEAFSGPYFVLQGLMKRCKIPPESRANLP